MHSWAESQGKAGSGDALEPPAPPSPTRARAAATEARHKTLQPHAPLCVAATLDHDSRKESTLPVPVTTVTSSEHEPRPRLRMPPMPDPSTHEATVEGWAREPKAGTTSFRSSKSWSQRGRVSTCAEREWEQGKGVQQGSKAGKGDQHSPGVQAMARRTLKCSDIGGLNSSRSEGGGLSGRRSEGGVGGAAGEAVPAARRPRHL